MKLFSFQCSMNYLGGYGIVLAENIKEAAELINKLEGLNNPIDLSDIKRINHTIKGTHLLFNGDY